MRARLFPPSNRALIIHELVHMGHPHPQKLLATVAHVEVVKLQDVPEATATAFLAWLQCQTPSAWWYHTPGSATGACDVLVSAAESLWQALIESARCEPSLRLIADALQQVWQWQAASPIRIELGTTTWELGKRGYVMGILNVTPDSFSDGGMYLQPEQACRRAEIMLEEGADLIDIGGESSRPWAHPVAAAVEQERVIPVVRALVKRYGAIVSVDTYRASVAAAALDEGAVLINDISALRFDARMAPLLARRGAAVALMHMQGNPQIMQRAPTYRHVVEEVYDFLAERLDYALQAGIPRQRIFVDPGFGFGKTIHHDLALLHDLERLTLLGQPLLVGTSRKAFLGRLQRRPMGDRLGDTLTTVTYAMQRGATMVRVHDVKPVVQALRLLEALRTLPAPFIPSATTL